MLARQGTLAAGLGLALLAPGLAQDSARLESLEVAWRHTTAALAELAGVEQRVAAGQPGALDHLRGVTEAPAAEPRALDALAAELERDVERLRSELSVALELPARPAPEPVDPFLDAAPRAGVGPLDPSLFPRATGARPSAGTGALVSATTTAPTTTPGDATTPTAPRPVPAGPVESADPLSHARAAYLAGDHGLAVALLEPVAGRPEADYWRAKSLERLDRASEALALYRAVAAGEDPLASQAQLDVDFLEWRAAYDDALARIANGGEEPR